VPLNIILIIMRHVRVTHNESQRVHRFSRVALGSTACARRVTPVQHSPWLWHYAAATQGP